VAVALTDEPADLVLAPHRSGDQSPSPIAPALAGLLDLPQATAVEALRLEAGEVVVVRRLDRGEREELALPLPAVVAIEPGLVRAPAATPAALIAARSGRVQALPPGPAAPRLVFRGHQPPRPPPPRMPAPDGGQPADARIAAVIGTAADGRQREVLTGTAEEVAERIVRALAERGHV